MTDFVRTPESQAKKLESLVGNPEELRERMESMVHSCLSIVEHDARYGAVVLRRIRDKELWRAAGWPSWAAFAGYWCPGGEERFNTLIVALEVLESRGEGRGFSEGDARKLAAERTAAAARATTGEPLAPGRPKAETAQIARLDQDSRGRANGISRRTQQKLDALAVEAPQLLDEVRAGRLSADRAARQAGIVKEPDAFNQLCRWWRKASAEQHDRFEDWIAEFRRREDA